MKTGVVKFFNESKGFGFITDDQSGKDIFVHATGVTAGKLKEGDKVTFDTEQGKKGPTAVKVRIDR